MKIVDLSYCFYKPEHFYLFQTGLTNDDFDEIINHLENVTYKGEFLPTPDYPHTSYLIPC